MAEFVVAASDSVPASRRFGDRFTVGDHTPIIQNAIDALPAAGGTVRILAGTYTLKKAVGKTHCILLNGSNKHLMLDAGAVLKLADGQFESSAGQVIQIGDDAALTGLATPNQIVEETNLKLWGSGIIDGNEANSNAKAVGVRASGNLLWFHIGGGLTIKNCESNPLTIQGISVGGDSADYSCKHTVIDDLRVIDSTEGMFLIRCKHTTIDHLHIENISAQDGLEPIICDGLTMDNSVIRDTQGSALDIFSSATSTTDSYQTYTNCTFGPMKVAGNVVSIGIGGETDHSHHKLNGCTILMKNAARGIYIGDKASGTATCKGISISNVTIDGTGAAAGADGIVIGIDATETTLMGNHISNCPGNAIDRSADPAKLHMKSNSGWGNGAGISAGIGADNIDTANDFI